MIIEMINEDIFESNADLLVNPVNCMGVMGKGLAKAIADRYPIILHPYKKACRSGDLMIGNIQVLDTLRDTPPFYIANLPTKNHWKHPSELEYVISGTLALLEWLETHAMSNVTKVAVPALGCGLGGLNWEEVKPELKELFQVSTNIDFLLYPPRSIVKEYH